jgi:hypothetical protein
MSDLEHIGDDQMDFRELAQHQPKRIDENTRGFKGMQQDEWYEIVQWLQLRMDDAANWSMTKIDVMYSDLKNYTKGDVFYAIQKLYEEGRHKAPDGGMILAKLKALSIPKVRSSVTNVENITNIDRNSGFCDIPGYSCSFFDSAWFSDDYGNWHFEDLCTANGPKGLCEARKKAVPNEHQIRTKPKKSTRAEMYAQLCKMKTMNEVMKKKVWKTYDKYVDGDLEEVISTYGKKDWYDG